MQIFLETERMLLRRFTTADVDNLVELDSDPDVMRFINGGRPSTRDEIESDVLPSFLNYYERYDAYGFWAAIDKQTDEFLGWFHFRPKSSDDVLEPELGYRLKKASWGKGLATEGSRALIDKAFSESGVQRVYAETMTINTGSRRVMEKSGLRFVRTFIADWPEKIEGDEHGDVEYEITRAEWEKQRGS